MPRGHRLLEGSVRHCVACEDTIVRSCNTVVLNWWVVIPKNGSLENHAWDNISGDHYIASCMFYDIFKFKCSVGGPKMHLSLKTD